MPENTTVGGVAFELNLNEGHFDNDVRQAGQRAQSRLTKDFQATGKGIENSFKTSFSNVGGIANSAASSMINGFKKVGAAVIAAFSIQKIKDFGREAIESAAKINAQESALAQTFREYEGAATAAMQRVAKESGIVETRLNATGTSIYAFAKSSGMDSAAALNMMEDALKATADSAAYYDRSLEDTAESLKSFLKGNYANDAALGVSATETTRNAAANKLYGQSFKDLSEAQKQLTLLQMVKDANAASGALGQAARESDSWENVIGNLKEAWNQLLAAVGQPILKGAVAVIQRLTEWITRLTSWAKAASQALGELFGWGSDQTAQTAANTAQTANAISDSVDNQNELTKAVEKTNAEVRRGVAGFDKLNIISKSTTGGSSGTDTANDNAPASLGGNIVGSVDLDTKKADDKIAELKKKIKAFFSETYKHSGLKNFVEEFQKSMDYVDLAYINSNLKGIGKDVQEIASETVPDISKMNQAFGGLAGAIASVPMTLAGKTTEFFTGGVRKWLDKDKNYIIDTTKEITGNMGSGFNNLKPIFDDVRDKIGTVYDKIKPFTEGAVADFLSGATHLFGESGKAFAWSFDISTEGIQKIYFWLTEDVPNGVDSAFESIKTFFSDVEEKAKKGFHTIVDPWIEIANRAQSALEQKIFKPIRDNFSGTKKQAGEAWEGIKKAFSPVADWFKNVFSNAWQGVKNVFSKGGEIFNGIKEGMFNTFKTVVNALIDGINTVIARTFEGLNNALRTIHDISILGVKPFEWIHTFDVPEIPKLAAGGIVKAPTLAVVGDNPGAGSGNPEVVAPLSQLQGMMKTSGSADTAILEKILSLLMRLYELFVMSRGKGGDTYEFIATLEGQPLFREVIRQNQLYKNTHGGKGAI